MERELLKPGEAAKMLGVSAQTIRNWAETEKIGFVTMPSGNIKIPKEAVEMILAGKKRKR